MVSRPEKKIADFCKPCFFLIYLYIVIYFFFIYLFKFIYIYLCIYICVYIYMCVCVMFCIYIYNYVYIYIYIYKCVCGGEVVSKWGVLFFSQRTLLGTKKRHLVLRHIHVYTIYYFFDMCFLFLSCVGLSNPKYMFSGFLLYLVFFSIILSEKCIKPKNV